MPLTNLTPRASFGATAALAALAACTTPAPRHPGEELAPISRSGLTYYARAKAAWADMHARPLTVVQADARRRVVVELLEDAVATDERWPLAHSMLGQIALDQGDAAALRRARTHFERAYELCIAWTPAWLGLARLSLLDGRVAEARQFLEGATWSLESLPGWGAPPPPGFVEFLVDVIGLPRPRVLARGALDPALPADRARDLLRAWLDESLSWDLRNAALLDPSAASGANAPSEDRLKARIVLLQAGADLLERVQAGGPVDAADYERGCRAALRFDPDFLEARLKLSRALAARGDLGPARANFEQVLLSRNPMLAHFDDLNRLALEVYAGTWAEHRRPEDLGRAIGYLQWLVDEQGGFREEPWRHVQSLFLALDTGDQGAVRAALGAMVAWSDGAGPDPRGPLVRRLLEAGRAELRALGGPDLAGAPVAGFRNAIRNEAPRGPLTGTTTETHRSTAR